MIQRKSTLIRHSLMNGPRSTQQLVSETGLSWWDVEERVARMRRRGQVVRDRHPDGRPRGWRLA